MPGVIPLEDAQQLYADRLRQHAESVWNTIQAAPQAAVSSFQQVAQPGVAAVQQLATPQVPQVDPSQIIQNLQQHAQDAWNNVQQAPQQVSQALQPAAQAVDPTAITQRLMQHAQDAFQSVDQTAQPIDQGLQSVAQPAVLPSGQAGVPGVDPRLSGSVQPPTRVTSATGESSIVNPPDRSMSYQDYARAAAQRAGIDPNVFVAQIQQESGFNPTARSPAGAIGIAQFMPETARGVGVDPTDPYAALDAAAKEDAKRLQQYGGDWGKTLASYNAGPGAVEQYGGIPPYQETQSYVKTIMGNARKAADTAGTAISNVVGAAGQAVDAAKQVVGGVAQGVLPAVSQFGDKQLTAAEAYAACGPAAAVRFAQMYGRNPTLREATDLARGVGWTEGSGMAGLQSESKLFDQMGIPHRVVGADWQALAREAESGNPVTISTPGHYFTADSYDRKTGTFHVGSSGTDLKGGSEWMTAAQMEAQMGTLQGGLAADNPGTPAPSPISSSPHPLPGRPGGLVTPPGQYNPPPGSIQLAPGLQQVDNAVQGAVSGATEAIGGAAGAVGAAASAVGTRARGVAEQAAAAVEPTVQRAEDLVAQAPLPFGAGKVSDVVGPAADLAGKVQTPDETNPLPARVAGTGLSALGTVVKAATDELDRLSIASTASREAAGEDVYAQKYATAGGPQLEDEYRQLLAKRMGGDDSVGPRMTEIAGQLQHINDAIRAGRPQSEVNQQLSEENPLTPVSSALTNLGAMVLAAPLAAGEAPLVARALAEIIQPGTNPVALARAVRIVEDSRVPASELVQAIDRVRKMPGTAELAPVRQQVQQSSTDLLQAMLDAAKAKGADPEKLAALEEQITTMDPTAATRRALTPSAPGGMRGAVSDFLTGTGGTGIRGGSELGAVNPRFGATLGGAVAGGYTGYETTPEDASPLERGLRTAGGAVLGASAGAALGSAAGFRGTTDQRIMESLRSAGLVAGPARAAPAWRGVLPEAVEATKQLLLTSPTTHIGNIIGNTIELGRQPIALAMGGRADDALAGATSVIKALPQAATNALEAIKGRQLASLSNEAANIPLRQPIYRALSAADAFTRTLAEYQGMSAEANRLLRDAGMSPSDPGVAAFLASHAADLFRAGARDGAQAVFAQAGATVGGAAGSGRRVQNIFQAYGRWKDGMLASPDRLHQAVGAFADLNLPFSGVPSRLLNIAVSRTPPGAQIGGAWRMAQALKAGDTAAFQRAAGETMLESSIEYLIGQNIANGNIRGPDDVEHPNAINMPGMGWVDTRELGAYALPMQIMAAWAEGWQKGGQNIPAGDDPLLPRFNAAFNASMVPFTRAIPGVNMIQVLSLMLQGNVTGAMGREAQDVINRLTVPGAARFIENATDPVARDVAKKGVASLWEPALAAWPGLAERLPVKIDPTTGEPMQKAKSGLGILVGAQQDVASPLTIEADRLKKMGYDVSAPKTYADSVTVGGSTVPLKPDEQRAVAQITGARLAQLGARIDAPAYQNLPDTRAGNDKRAAMLKAIINAADVARTNAAQQVLGKDELRQRILANRQIGGRLVEQAPAPTLEDAFANFNPTGEHVLTQRALAGSRA